MNIEAKVKRILDPETFPLQDGRTYTQQLVILDCGEYSKAGDFYENDIPVYFGERNLDKLRHRGCKSGGAFRTERTRLHLHRQDGRQDAARGLQPKSKRL